MTPTDPFLGPDRRPSGDWGANLEPAAFGAALAGALFLPDSARSPAELPVGWPARGILRQARPWCEAQHLDPAKSGALWQFEAWVISRGLRLLLMESDLPARDDLEAWVSALRDAPGVASVVVERPAPKREVAWHWPFDFGFLQTPRSAALRSGFDDRGGLEHLRRTVAADASSETIDLLVLPRCDLDVDAPRPAGRVNAVLVWVEPADREPALEVASRALRRFDAEAAVVVATPEDPAGWLVDLVAALSHDQALDVALFETASKGGTSLPPLILARGTGLDASRLSDTVVSIADRLHSRGWLESAEKLALNRLSHLQLHDFEGLSGALRRRGWDLDHPKLAVSADPDEALEAALSDFEFHAESHGATDLLPLTLVGRELLETPLARHLQARVTRADAGKEAAALQVFEPGARHAVHVAIAPPQDGWSALAAPFPIDELPPSTSGHTLTVVLAPLVGRERTPLMRSLHLPAAGPSDSATVEIVVPNDVPRYRARLAVLHQGRVLQTAVLDGWVGAGQTEERIRLIPEAILRGLAPEPSDQGFDATLVFNHTPAGEALILAIKDQEADLLVLPDKAEQAARSIGELLDEYAEGQDGTPDDERTRQLYVRLARAGRVLARSLEKDAGLNAAASADRLQVISARPDAVLPLEVCYDGPPPDDAATVCPTDLQMDPAGDCSWECPGASRGVVCPLAFWGLHKVIERHLHAPAVARAVTKEGADFAVLQARATSEDRRRREQVGLGDGVLWASSVRANRPEGVLPQIVAALDDDLGSERFAQVSFWADWENNLNARSPGVLVVLGHTVGDAATLAIEIDRQDRLPQASIEADRHVLGRDGRRPIVLLLGCDTAVGGETPFTLLATWRQEQAAVVVGTYGRVIGRHAAGTGAELVRSLLELSASGAADPALSPTVGDAFRMARRRLVAAGKTMALGLVAFGDADWRL